MRLAILGIVLIVTCAAAHAQPERKRDDAAVRAALRAPDALLGELVSDDSDTRQTAAWILQEQRRKSIARLIEIVDTGDAGKYESSSRAIASQLLGDWRASEAMPVLVKHLSYQVLTSSVIARPFPFEAYPCADAIRKMGMSALPVFLDEVVVRKEPLSDDEIKIATWTVYAVCGHDKEFSLLMIQRAEKVNSRHERLTQIREYLEGSIPRKPAEAKQSPQ